MKIQIPLHPIQKSASLEQADPRVTQLLKTFVSQKYAEALLADPHVQREFAEWLKRKPSDASTKTTRWELRRVKQYADGHPDMGILSDEIDQSLHQMGSSVANAAAKAKLAELVDEEFLKRLQEYAIRVDTTETARNAYILFTSTLMTGLRPSEWGEVALMSEGGRPMLKVKNAKQKSGLEAERILYLDTFKPAHTALIVQSIKIAGESTSPQQFGKHSGALRRLVKRAGLIEEDELLSVFDLSTGRKIYAMESARSGKTEKHIAACLGHLTTFNLKWYLQGEIQDARFMRYPLATVDREAENNVRDTLVDVLRVARKR